MQRLSIALLAFAVSGSSALAAGAEKASKPPALPRPLQTYPDRKPYNALRLGPGNTFSVSETPKDYTLVSFTLSSDGQRLALGWESGKIELFDLRTRKPLAEFKSGSARPIF